MSTAVGHGLVGPNARGKPVSFAKRDGVPIFGPRRGGPLVGVPASAAGRVLARASPAQKGNPVNIPELGRWTEGHSLLSDAEPGPRKGDGLGDWGEGPSGSHLAATLSRPLGHCP